MQLDFNKLIEELSYNPKEPLLFNSGFFIWFFALFIITYSLVAHYRNARVITFVLFSLYFFYKASGWFVGLVLLSAVIDFTLSNLIYKTINTHKRKALLVLSVVLNLGMLFYFKYTNFFIQLYNEACNGHIHPLNLILPVGISFYTFENLSYTVDVYRGHFKPVSRFIDYLYFLSFFPKLMMGPIVRAADFLPQLNKPYFVSKEDFASGFYLIFSGLFKKIVISDFINVNFVGYIFDDPSKHTGLECLLGVYGYALVIYSDFSGYSDMAIGIARWCGFNIPPNFDSPYQSSSITEFWRRWHISLSSWLRDYLYIPLGGNRKGKVRQYVNLFITMLLGGFWHGANWNFIIWGGMHGAALSVDKAKDWVCDKLRINKKQVILKAIGIIVTFNFVCFCWIFFRANSLGDAQAMLHQIFFNFDGSVWKELYSNYQSVFLIMLIGFVLHFVTKKQEDTIKNSLVNLPLAGYLTIAFILFFIFIQIKTAEPVMPVYLQF
ncbi:MBOAT family O-acyltransferase [Ferruginibacter albus]|uniref:MBOAT family O-acyltransferase n=1 Tax=Ferruginibacter albus TaxID=2875540 RepID=UPI001CC6BE24|nr:MBOAT family O-acyltransferase [Ferruginibacter albus]UAY52426.1 MBOAT family protein [Ferruginibacter albus]